MALIEEKTFEIGAKHIEIWSTHRVKMMIKLSLMNITTKESAFIPGTMGEHCCALNGLPRLVNNIE